MNESQDEIYMSKSTSTIAPIPRTSSNVIKLARRMAQNYLVIWADDSIDSNSQDCQNTLVQLRTVVNDVYLFTTKEQCITFLKDMNDGNAFVISSRGLGQRLVSDIHSMPVVDVIYIFCNDKVRHELWTKEWSKIRGVHTTIETICQSLKKVARRCDNDRIPISFVPKRTMVVATSGEFETQNLDQLEPSYMYSLLFKEIMLEIDGDDRKFVKELVLYCRKKNVPESELKDFQQHYHNKSPIWWYTFETFLYAMLNYALLILDIETMLKMGFFIRHLHRELEKLHRIQARAYLETFIVYRGQGLSRENFQTLLDTKGGLIAFNNFLSTSKKREVAMDFAELAMENSKDTLGVIFIMTINPRKVSTATTPYAMIDAYSAVPSEQEILFTMHTVFRVGNINQTTNNSRLWEVQLTITNENDPQLTALTNRMKEEVQGSNGWHRMGELMLKMGHFNQAEELYSELLKKSFSNNEKAYVYHKLGCVKRHQGEYKQAIDHLDKSLLLHHKPFQEDDLSLADLYNDIGVVSSDMSNLLRTLKYYSQARTIKEKALPLNHVDLATSYNNIAVVYKNMGEYSKALEFYTKSLKIREKALPSNHPNLATSCNNIGLVYDYMGDYSKALQYYEKSRKICELALPHNHPALASSYSRIGSVFANMGDYSKFLQYYEKSLKIRETVLASNHPDLADSYDSIGSVYASIDDYSNALQYYRKSLHIKEISLTLNHPGMANSYDNIAFVHGKMGGYSKAFDFYGKSLKVREVALPSNHPDLATSFNSIGLLYEDMSEYSKSISYLEKALHIRQLSLSASHSRIKKTIESLDGVYNRSNNGGVSGDKQKC